MKVAKHGNRAASSKCGAADCLEALGVNINQSPDKCVELFNKVGICFFFAQKYHSSITSIVAAVRANTKIPCAIGFGISTPAQARKMADISDGAIVGSAIIKILAQHGQDAPKFIGEYVYEMKNSMLDL